MKPISVLLCLGFAAGGCDRIEVVSPQEQAAEAREEKRPAGVCPPFTLRTESGQIIDPVSGQNVSKPYSPRQTCGASGCHDYKRITKGYHFTQGAGEEPPQPLSDRCQWVTSPGNYGGAWCSPAPLYRYLSKKNNDSAAEMDMTSFTFLADGCGACHPGGGSAEIDRSGKRYDTAMADPHGGLESGGNNGFDGDYYQARWSESGVLEADCLICHMPGYDMPARRSQISDWNYRWAATSGAGLADVTGSMKGGRPVELRYDESRFSPDGTVTLHLVREPRNEACLFCHAKPGWKKRGTNFSPRTDVHLRAGLKCVDCHPAGSSAEDLRITGREVHQIAKGDDPGGLVRDDLDGTVRACTSCHKSGELGAPIARHDWLPPLHLDELSCQACHIPERAVKAALVQAGDVFNPGARIPTKGKHLWTFYGPDGRYWNHYGDLALMGYDDKPTDPFRPVYVRYKGKIRPANRIHSAWPAIEVEGRTGLMQPRMGDVYRMWDTHRKDPARYAELATITDDNGDGVIEVNRPEEIDALIQAVTDRLSDIKYPMEGKRVVWVSDDREYSSGTEFRVQDKRQWEASPYANVHTYNHDVAPARAALGSGGCLDCHRKDSTMFAGGVLAAAFDPDDARSIWRPNHELLGLSATSVYLGALRETWLKPAVYWLLGFVLVLLFSLGLGQTLVRRLDITPRMVSVLCSVCAAAGAAALLALTILQDWMAFLFVSRFTLDASHGWIALLAFLMPAGISLAPVLKGPRWIELASRIARSVICVSLGFAAVCGLLMVLKLGALSAPSRLAYTGLELGFLVALGAAVVILILSLITFPRLGNEPATSGVVRDKVKSR